MVKLIRTSRLCAALVLLVFAPLAAQESTDSARLIELNRGVLEAMLLENDAGLLVENAYETLRVLGGYGYMQEYEVERALRDGVASVLYSGTSDIQRNVVAAWLGL